MPITILIGFAVILVAFAVFVATRPSTFRIARGVTIAAPARVVFAHVNDLRKFQEWSPFAKLDPAAKNTFDGPASGVGASMAYSGNRDVGEGRSTITDSRPDELIRFKLEFKKPFEVTHVAEFTFVPDGDKTVVTWSLNGTSTFACKAMCLFINRDKLCGGLFEKGLADLKQVSEAEVGK